MHQFTVVGHKINPAVFLVGINPWIGIEPHPALRLRDAQFDIQHQGGGSSLVPIRKESAKRRVGNLIGLELIPDQFGKQSGDVTCLAKKLERERVSVVEPSSLRLWLLCRAR